MLASIEHSVHRGANAETLLGECTTEPFDGCDLPKCIDNDRITDLIECICAEACDATAERELARRIDVYLAQPTLLAPHLPAWIGKLAHRLLDLMQNLNDWDQITLICRILYEFCRVCGMGMVCVHLECHRVELVVPTLRFLQLILDPVSISAHSAIQENFWMVRYVGMLMGSLSVLIPFDLSKFGRRIEEASCSPDLFDQVFASVQERLSCNGREREAAVAYISSILKRPDSKERLRDFIVWTGKVVKSNESSLLGALECLCRLAKGLTHGDLEPHRLFLAATVNDLQVCPAMLASPLLRKCNVKLQQRLAMFLNVQQALDVQLSGISDRDTVVRWSAAKGLASLCSNLTADSQNKVVENLLSCLDNMLSPAAVCDPCMVHGYSLALAQLLYSRLISSTNLTRVVRMAMSLLHFEVPRGRYAVGSVVRDAACYMVWAMARTCYSMAHLVVDLGTQLGGALLCTALFDREVQCRRAAAAAFQEIVGRMEIIPHGVSLLADVNFWNVSQRSLTFGLIAEKVAEDYPIYLPAILDHLVGWALCSWDKNVRSSSANLLGVLSPRSDPRSIISIIEVLVARSRDLDDLSIQHGAILGLARLVGHSQGLAQIDTMISVSLMLNDMPAKLLGWEMLADATCQLISAIARLAAVPVTATILSGWLITVQNALKSREDSLHRLVSEDTLPAIVSRELTGSPLVCEFFRGTVLPTADKDRSFHAQRGFTLAISAMPAWLFLDRIAPVTRLLCKFVRATSPTNHIERRCNAVIAAGNLYGKLAEAPEIMDEMTNSLLWAMEDYSVDSRGDVGSHVRLCAMQSLSRMIRLLSAEQLLAYQGRLSLHLVDKLDRLRAAAQFHLAQMGHFDCPALRDHCHDPVNFFSQLDPFFLRDAANAHFRPFMMTGLISSGGCVNPIISGPAVDLLDRIIKDGCVSSDEVIQALIFSIQVARLQRSSILLIERLLERKLFAGLPDDLTKVIQSLILDPRASIHNVFSAVNVMLLLSEQDIHADWIREQGEKHPYPRVQELIQTHLTAKQES